MTTISLAAADPQASPKAQEVLNYPSNLPNRFDNRVISGQFEEGNGDINKIYQLTGKYAGMVGVDYKFSSVSSANSIATSYWNNKGLVTLTCHSDNPVSGESAWSGGVNMNDIATPGTTANTKFKVEMDRIASGLQSLQNAGVVVLWRPFHEMDGSWFWWCGNPGNPYKNAWIYMFNYFTQTKGLHNLLWVWSSYYSLDMNYYPGSHYVDIIGIDKYGIGDSGVTQVNGYAQLSSLGKPFALTEFGLCNGGYTWDPSSCPPRSLSNIMPSIRSQMLLVTYILFWDGVYSINYSQNSSAFMADSWVVTRDELPDFSSTNPPADTTPPAAPKGLKVQ